jgi:MinD-like ATPase involved in chromosome partitioning or flagellar assembly
MCIVAVAGDFCTTTAVALAAAWPAADDVLVVEADPTGGDLAAWFDIPATPSLSTIVTSAPGGAWPEVARLTRLADSGLRLVPAPSRAAEAAQAVTESTRSLVQTLAVRASPVTIADVGGLPIISVANPFLRTAAVTVAVHRQSAQSPRAAAVRLQRFADQLDVIGSTPTTLIVAVVGGSPFDISEIESFLAGAAGVNAVVGLPVDDLAAAVFGGRSGVSTRRLGRLPLVRSAGELARVVRHSISSLSGDRSKVDQ